MTIEKLNVGLSEQAQGGVVETLNKLLADEFLLYTKFRNYHWNVVGPHFRSLHELFEEQYEALEDIIDEVAENARQFGGLAKGTMTEFLRMSRLKEEPGKVPDARSMVQDLVNDHESVIRALRGDIERAEEEFHAADAADFLTGVLEKHNEMAWMLRAFITDTPGGQRDQDRRFDESLAGSRH